MKTLDNGWTVFESEQERETVINSLRLQKEDSSIKLLDLKSTIDLPAFCEFLEGIGACPVFNVNLSSDDMKKPFEALLVGDKLIHLLGKFRELLLSGVLCHFDLQVKRCDVGLFSANETSVSTAAQSCENKSSDNGG